MRAVLADLRRMGRFTPVAPYQRLGYVCGALLILSGLFHGVVFMIDGGSWEGPLSWRKPIVFGLSFGITLMTLSWIMGFLRPRRRAAWLLVGVFAFASVGEVFLISMQTWRGVASHFNEDTAFDGMVFSLMGTLVGLVALVTVAITVWTFARMDAPPSLAYAIRLGLVLMLVSQVVGVQMIVEGSNTFGDSGALKVPHAVTLHAAQVLPALALLLLVGEYLERRRLEIVAVGAAGYAALIASTMVLTYAGRSPLDLTAVSSVLALLGLVLLAASAAFAVYGLAGRLRPHILAPTEMPRMP
jgi:hypothetical protein